MPVHPHACGERSGSIELADVDGGSSPRVWGTGRAETVERFIRRFIPTRVGNGIVAPRTGALATVHPHACGERGSRANIISVLGGSSPRVWGTGINEIPRLVSLWFIPTRVGNGESIVTSSAVPAVHPHACGERAVTPMRTRPKTRFIPTRVGNGVFHSGNWDLPSVHPHACGERTLTWVRVPRQVGSSPRVWGTGGNQY